MLSSVQTSPFNLHFNKSKPNSYFPNPSMNWNAVFFSNICTSQIFVVWFPEQKREKLVCWSELGRKLSSYYRKLLIKCVLASLCTKLYIQDKLHALWCSCILFSLFKFSGWRLELDKEREIIYRKLKVTN